MKDVVLFSGFAVGYNERILRLFFVLNFRDFRRSVPGYRCICPRYQKVVGIQHFILLRADFLVQPVRLQGQFLVFRFVTAGQRLKLCSERFSSANCSKSLAKQILFLLFGNFFIMKYNGFGRKIVECISVKEAADKWGLTPNGNLPLRQRSY